MGNVADTLRKLGVPDEISVPGGVATMARPVDPLQQALEDRRAAQAMRQYDGMEAEAGARIGELEATRMNAQLTQLETRARMNEIQASLAEKGGGGTTGVIIELMKFMHENGKELAQQNNAMMERVMAVQQEAAGAVRQEIQALAERSGDKRDQMTTITEQITGLQSVMQAIKAFMPATPELAGAMRSAAEEIQILKATKEVEFTAMRMREEHEARMADLRLREQDQAHRHSLDQQKYEVDKERYAGVASTLKSFVPAAVSVFTDIAHDRFSPHGATVATAAAEALPMQTIKCDAALDEGQGECGNIFEVAMGSTSAVCPKCHVMSDIRGG